MLRTNRGAEVEFITLTLWKSLEAIREFAGAATEVAVVPPEAQKLLARYDTRSQHYGTLWCP